MINWTLGTIQATGQAVIGDVRTRGVTRARDEAVVEARQIALSRLIRALSDLNVNGRTTVRSLLESSDDTAERFSQAPQRAVEKSRRVAEGFVTVELEMPIGGSRGLISLIQRPRGERGVPTAGHGNPEDRMTGILIDATETGFTPVLEPRLFTESGRLISDGRPCAGSRAPVVYHISRDLAARDRRLGDSPYRVYAASRSQAAGDLFISAEDSLRILGSKSGRKALESCAVVILVKKPAGQ